MVKNATKDPKAEIDSHYVDLVRGPTKPSWTTCACLSVFTEERDKLGKEEGGSVS